jgi:hypothetical protein
MQGFGLAILFGLGWLTSASFLAVPIFVYSLARGRRAFHADGTVYRAEVKALDGVVGPRLAGPALVRLSGAFLDEGQKGTDVLGMAVRLRHVGDPSDDARIGDQDLLFGTFESFATAAKDREKTDVNDFLANEYASVTPWKADGVGVVHLRAMPPAPRDPARADTRLGRLDVDIAAGRAVFVLETRGGGAGPVAELRLLERTTLDGRTLRISMFRTERGLSPVGFRNGIRAVVYPVSQAARRLRGG